MPEIPLRPLRTLKIIAGGCRDRCLVADQDKPPVKFRCFLNLALVIMEWSAFFPISPCLYLVWKGGQFQILPEELKRFLNQ